MGEIGRNLKKIFINTVYTLKSNETNTAEVHLIQSTFAIILFPFFYFHLKYMQSQTSLFQLEQNTI